MRRGASPSEQSAEALQWRNPIPQTKLPQPITRGGAAGGRPVMSCRFYSFVLYGAHGVLEACSLLFIVMI